jgi:hypothetical protein
MSSSTYDDSVDPSQDEETPLLSSEPISEPVMKDLVTPVPWAQLWVLLVLQLAEPLTSQVIYPFAPEVRHFSRWINFFFSVLLYSLSAMWASRMAMNPVWDIMLDCWCASYDIPCILHITSFSNPFSLQLRLLLSYYGVGFLMSWAVSRSFSRGYSACLCLCSVSDSQRRIGVHFSGMCICPHLKYVLTCRSRGLHGALNGNSGIMKSIVAEITDPTNLPLVYAYMPVSWSTGSTLG